MKNEFILEGKVIEVEALTGRNDTPYWKIKVDAGGRVPLTVFDEVSEGDEIRVKGGLGEWVSTAGYSNLQTKNVKVDKIQGPATTAQPQQSSF